jgi:DNA invertase Pin-like site-specific DNA recombinase
MPCTVKGYNLSIFITITHVMHPYILHIVKHKEEFEDTKGVIKLKLCLLSSVQQEEFEDTKGG